MGTPRLRGPFMPNRAAVLNFSVSQQRDYFGMQLGLAATRLLVWSPAGCRSAPRRCISETAARFVQDDVGGGQVPVALGGQADTGMGGAVSHWHHALGKGIGVLHMHGRERSLGELVAVA